MSDIPKQPAWHVSKKLRSRARVLRRNSTDAEKLIRQALRADRLKSAGFRRQTPIGPYVADFVCHAANLIVEIDGGQHFEKEQMSRDARREAFLASRGYQVLRFSNHDVMANRQGVLETIAAALAVTPSLPLPRERGRESVPAGSGGAAPRGAPR